MMTTAYDSVGAYNQDASNGFSEKFLDEFAALVLSTNGTILDAMSGNGNLTSRLLKMCPTASVTMLELSPVQCALADERLPGIPCICGSVFDHSGVYDTVVIKSGFHEVPQRQQQVLCDRVYDQVAPGGRFINLGVLFADPEVREELQIIVLVKDALAGMLSAVKNRYMPLRTDFYQALRSAGFSGILDHRVFTYRLDSRILTREYFKGNELHHDIFRAAQLRCLKMKRCGMIEAYDTHTIMYVPAEITVAYKASL